MNRLISLPSTDSPIQDVCVEWGWGVGVRFKLVVASCAVTNREKTIIFRV